MHFANPWNLLLLLLVPPLVFLSRALDRRMRNSFRFSNYGLVEKLRPTFKVRLSGSMVILRGMCLAAAIVAFARPQIPIEETKVYVEGVNMVLVLDTSGSMHAMDFEMDAKRVDRLFVVKKVVDEFVKHRPNDRIGVIAFSAQAYTICPLTLDHDWLEKNLERVQIGMIEDGTAIGSAMTASLNRLKNVQAKDRVIILLTDGRNNAGKISPLAAAEAAKTMGIRIYTIGVGTKGLAPYPVKDMFGNVVLQPVEIDLDEGLLKKIASITDGRYFRATDTASLWDIYKEIDKLEKTKIEEVGYNRFNELFGWFLFPALLIFMFELMLSNTVCRRIP